MTIKQFFFRPTHSYALVLYLTVVSVAAGLGLIGFLGMMALGCPAFWLESWFKRKYDHETR